MRRDERGQNLVETALVVPLLLLVLAGVADLGRAFYSYITITNAAREGARMGARLPCKPLDPVQRQAFRTAIVNAAVGEASGGWVTLGAGNIAIDPDPTTGCPATKGPLRVRVTLPYSSLVTLPFMSFIGGFTGFGTINLSNSAVMEWFGND